MTVFEFGAIGEGIGAIGVIVTLLYLAIQIRQNTKQLRFTASNTLWEGLSRAYDPAYIGDNMSAYRKGAAGEPMSADERMTFMFLAFRAFSHFYQLYTSYEEGFIREHELVMNRAVLVSFMAEPGMRAYWDNVGFAFFSKDSFREWVEATKADSDRLTQDQRLLGLASG